MYLNLPAPDQENLERKYQDHYESWERVLFEIHRRIRSELAQVDVRATVKYRVKSFQSYYKKLVYRASLNAKAPVIELTDLLGMRIVCPFMEDLELVEAVLGRQYSLIEREKKGAEFSFKEFGYESVHFLMNVPDEVRDSFHLSPDTVIEVQLRTILQDAWAEVEHELVYKSEYSTFDEPLRRKLAALNANLSLADMIFHEIRVFQRELQRQIRRRREAFTETLLEESPLNERKDQTVFPSPGVEEMVEVLPSGNTADHLLLKALYAHNRHDYRRAIDLYSHLLEEDPRPGVLPVVLIHRGMAYFSLGDYDRAHDDFDRAVNLNADLRRAYHYRGISFIRRGDNEAALEDFTASLALDNRQYDVLLSRSQTYARIGKMHDALRDCDDALALAPDSDQARRFHHHITNQMGM